MPFRLCNDEVYSSAGVLLCITQCRFDFAMMRFIRRRSCDFASLNAASSS
ncbi:MAG: hypothetical protein LBF01_00680 [Bacteroidales bacterium]|nr:hypothetical protein [Bacteroidales bacterium]